MVTEQKDVSLLLSKGTSTRLSRFPQYLVAVTTIERLSHISPLWLGGCPNLISVNIGGYSRLPKSILEISIPSLTRLRCNFNEYTAQDFASPFFQSIRYLQPIWMLDPGDWLVWTTGGLRNMRNLTYLAVEAVYVLPGTLRQKTAALLASLPSSLKLLILSLPHRMRHDPDFEDLRTGKLHPRAIPFIPPYDDVTQEDWVMVEHIDYQNATYCSVDPEPFWEHGMQMIQHRLSRVASGSRIQEA